MPPLTIYRPTRTHPASLISASKHHPDLLRLMSQRVNTEMVDHIAAKVREVVPRCCDTCHPPVAHKRPDSLSTLPSPPVTPTKPMFQNGSDRRSEYEAAPLPMLEDFLGNIISSSKIQAPTLLCTLIYLDRIRPKLPPIESAPHSRSPDVQHRVLMATIVCAAKYLNDSSPKNKHWALYSFGLLTCQDVNAMELQLLGLLDWDLRLAEDECTSAFSVFFGRSESRTTKQPLTPPKDTVTRIGLSQTVSNARPNPHLPIPSNRRASRPARIEISTGPAHLHTSFTRSDASNTPLSPPPSAVSASFHLRQDVSPGVNQVGTSNGDSVKPVGYMHTYGARYPHLTEDVRPVLQARSSSSHPNVRFAADPVAPAGKAATRSAEDGVSSWSTLSRANGILERVWGNGHHTGRSAMRSSRSVGGLFRAATSHSLAEQATTRV
ncbi:unnamed protein product [Rhizoctonia solani]|uniref:Cyclin N-terminal domain-containing protein n=1 Tax=Rhizoctonia solani TaxID=456999 RepID=A0A8H2WX78_9AGAM|nr:unnamed protein product [Rhizoctonia solani]